MNHLLECTYNSKYILFTYLLLQIRFILNILCIGQTILCKWMWVLYLPTGQRSIVRLLKLARPFSFHWICGHQIAPTSSQWTTMRWGVIQQRICQWWVDSIVEVEQHLLHVWHGMEQSITDSAIDDWHRHLHACVQAKGGHVKQLLWQHH